MKEHNCMLLSFVQKLICFVGTNFTVHYYQKIRESNTILCKMKVSQYKFIVN